MLRTRAKKTPIRGGVNMALLLVLAIASTALASSGRRSGSIPSTAPGPGSDEPRPDSAGTLDQLFLEIARRVPSFAGLHIDEPRGELFVHLTDATTGASAVRDVAAEVLNDPTLRSLTAIRTPATYSFRRLHLWYEPLTHEIASIEGVLTSDIDERRNQIVIGVQNRELDEPAIRARAAQLDVPDEALLVEERSRSDFNINSSLQDTHRPVVGGLQVQYQVNTTTAHSCTLGFNARRVSSGAEGFVTNSHCSKTFGALDGTSYGQPLYTPILASETVDPPLFTGGDCPAGRKCRYSDSLFASFVSPIHGATHLQGRIGKTALNDTAAECCVAWDGSSTFQIWAKQQPLDGATVLKTGRTTGRTRGVITATCVKTEQSDNGVDTGRTMLCQMHTSTGSRLGDSGSAVYSGGSSDSRSLHGILWGGSPSSSVFSPWNQLTKSSELGSLKVCSPELYSC